MLKLKKGLRLAFAVAVTSMAVGCGPGPEEELVDGAPQQEEVVTTEAPADDGTVHQAATYYRWVDTGLWCKTPIDVGYECRRRGYDGGTSSTCGKTGTLLVYCYVRT